MPPLADPRRTHHRALLLTDRRSFYGLNSGPSSRRSPSFATCASRRLSSGSARVGIGAGLVLAPAIAVGPEARGQGLLVDVLFWVNAGYCRRRVDRQLCWHYGLCPKRSCVGFGNQGLSYIQLVWFLQIGFFLGLLICMVPDFRALWLSFAPSGWGPASSGWDHSDREPDLGCHDEHRCPLRIGNDAAHRHREVFHSSPISGGGGWRILLWVEQSFEFFAASMSALNLLHTVGLVSRKLAERAVYFALILIFLGGVLGPRASPLLGRRAKHVGTVGTHALANEVSPLVPAGHRGYSVEGLIPGARGSTTTLYSCLSAIAPHRLDPLPDQMHLSALHTWPTPATRVA